MFFFARAVAVGGIAVDQARPGVRLPGHATASGRVFLAHWPWKDALAWLRTDGLTSLTPATTTDEPALQASLAEVRRSGLAVLRDEVVVGVGQIAVPVWGPGDRVVAALGISVRTTGVDAYLARNEGLLAATSAALSAALRGAVTPAAREAMRVLVLEV
jgi:DNA-binding IclR family transcriptional regulator